MENITTENVNSTCISPLEKYKNYEVSGYLALEELYDKRKARCILKYFDELEDEIGCFKDVKNNFAEINDKETKRTIFQKFLKKKNPIVYKYSTGENKGRMFGKNCFQGMPKTITHTLAKDIYGEIDIFCAFQTFATFICKCYNIKCEWLEYYIKNREECLKSITDKFECTRDYAKKLILAIMNGGKNHLRSSGECPTWLLKYEEEVDEVRKTLCDNYFKNELDKIKKNSKKKHNPYGCCISKILCQVENKVIQCMKLYCDANKVKVGTLKFDSLYYKLEDVKDVEKFIKGLEENVKLELGIDIILEKKEMDKAMDLTKYLDKYVTDFDVQQLSDQDCGIVVANYLIDNHNILYSKTRKIVYLYNEETALYEENDKETIKNYISEILEDYFEYIGLYRVDPEDYSKEDKKIIIDRLKYIRSTNVQDRILKQVMTRLRNDEIFIDEKLDQIPHLFPFGKNVIDFKTFEVRERRKEDYFTKTTENTFIPKKEQGELRTKFFTYVKEILNTKNMKYVDNFLTLLSITLTNEELKMLLFVTGTGDNGKSLCMNNLLGEGILQTFYVLADYKVFLKERGMSGHTAELIPLISKRLIIAPDSEEDGKFNESRLKSITGGDGKLPMRDCGGKQFNQKINGKIILPMNTHSVPEFQDKEGFQNRLINVPFTNTFPKSLKKKEEILGYKDIMFSVLCEYAHKYYLSDRSYTPCKEMNVATKELIDDKDEVVNFMENIMEITHNPKHRMSKPYLFEEFNKYCGLPSNNAKGRNKFYSRMINEFGLFEHRRTHFKGIRERLYIEESEEEVEEINEETS